MIRRLLRARLGEAVFAGEQRGEEIEVQSVETGGLKVGAVLATKDVTLLTPVKPSKIVAIALNYRKHAEEMKKPIPEEPLFFFKPLSALIGPGDAIRLPPESAEVHHEAEMGIVVGRTLSRVSPEDARDAIFGITCVNDVTARDIQRKQAHYTRSKGYDTFCPIGPYVVTGIDPQDLSIRLRINGEIKQDGRTSDLIFDVYKLLSFVSHVMTLNPGDVISTGTPSGVGPIKAGENVEVELEHVGVLRNPVVAL